jgi:hypothetical protein
VTLSAASGTVDTMTRSAGGPAELLMLSGVSARCADCGDERVFVPTGDSGAHGEFCCTGCDAAVFLMAVVGPVPHRDASRVA